MCSLLQVVRTFVTLNMTEKRVIRALKERERAEGALGRWFSWQSYIIKVFHLLIFSAIQYYIKVYKVHLYIFHFCTSLHVVWLCREAKKAVSFWSLWLSFHPPVLAVPRHRPSTTKETVPWGSFDLSLRVFDRPSHHN